MQCNFIRAFSAGSEVGNWMVIWWQVVVRNICAKNYLNWITLFQVMIENFGIFLEFHSVYMCTGLFIFYFMVCLPDIRSTMWEAKQKETVKHEGLIEKNDLCWFFSYFKFITDDSKCLQKLKVREPLCQLQPCQFDWQLL